MGGVAGKGRGTEEGKREREMGNERGGVCGKEKMGNKIMKEGNKMGGMRIDIGGACLRRKMRNKMRERVM